MKKLFVIVLLGAIIGSALPVCASTKKVAVIDFDDAAISVQGTPNNALQMLLAMRGQQAPKDDKGKIGRTVANILVTELVKDGTFKVIERSQLESIFKEQNLSLDGVVSATDAAKIGNVLGVSALITGSVTEFTVDSKHRGILGVGVTTNSGKVAVNVRIIDTSSGEILFASEGAGEESSSGVSVGSVYNSSDGNYENTLLGIATKKALSGIIAELKKHAAQLKAKAVSGYVAYFDEAAKTYLLDIGKDNGLEKDSTIYALRVAREVKSPATGEVIKRITNTVAELKVTDLDSSTATAICVTGNCGDVKEKDMVSTAK